MNAVVLTPGLVRERLRVRGTVQGVGFRPFVYRLALELGLDGWVLNDGEGVLAEVQGGPAAVTAFARRLACEAPPLARVERVEREPRGVEATHGFTIESSRGGAAATPVTPDAATCPECLAEILDPANRRYRYPFTNCTHCGPRFTITRRVPYDRPGTTMAPFAMCPACEREYRDPLDRRFHAQPNACPACGPRLTLLGADGVALGEPDVVAAALRLIGRGELVALKGLGGFHLACDARNAEAVARLRAAKGREEKPFAVMFANVASIEAFARVDEDASALLQSRERPIVLLDKLPGCDAELPGVAPGTSTLGAMLPYTPLHHLLFADQPLALVMTSANPGGEPLVTGNDEAVRRLAGIADAFVVHDRDICARCDDSVVRAAPGGAAFIRRARGFTPRAIRLPRSGPPVLACGAWLKNTVCVTRGDEAFLSPHIGDLDNVASCEALDEAALHLLEILQVEPAACAHDLHPDFYSTRFAARLARERGIPAIAVQHHHAHIAAVCAEHGIEAAVIGVALDGVGHGTDGAAWGGELLRVGRDGFTRLGNLRPVRLPGGDRAAREPWRVAASLLHAMGRGGESAGRFPRKPAAMIDEMLAKRVNCPETTSAGRWFDGAAALLGVREMNAFEGQAAMQLEALAHAHGPVAADHDAYRIEADGTIDLLPLAARLAATGNAGFGAALFHATLVEALAEWAHAAAQREGLSTVVLGGGCFMNAILARGLRDRLEAMGLAVLEARAAPPNDGGIALGQAWVAIERIS